MRSQAFRRPLTAPKGSFFLFGPRGVSKSTCLRQAFPSAPRIARLDETLCRSHRADISRFAGELRLQPAGSIVLVDEVQRIAPLLDEVRRFMEDRRLRFVLCGSSARKLRTAGTDPLAGRDLILQRDADSSTSRIPVKPS